MLALGMVATGNDRAVSNVIGAVFLIGVLVILLSVYQAAVVPSQNKKVEFDHSKLTQNDMLELRNAILEAKGSGRTTFAEVKLGTDYPPRTFALNPPRAQGFLRTGESEVIEIIDKDGNSATGVCPSENSIETRTLTLNTDYQVYGESPTIVYENTVLYLNFSGDKILLTDEQLVGNKINISPLNTSFNEQGVEATSVEPIPGQIKEKQFDQATLKLPTKLSEDTWEDLLSEDLDPSKVTKNNGKIEIATNGKFTFSCSPTGLNKVPAGGEREDEDLSINPAGPNDVELANINLLNNKNRVDITFNNTGDQDTNLTQARLSFYFNRNDNGGKSVDPLDIYDPDTGNKAAQLTALDPLEDLNPEITLPGNGTETTIRFDRTGGDKFSDQDFFVIDFRFENGKTGTYFVGVPK